MGYIRSVRFPHLLLTKDIIFWNLWLIDCRCHEGGVTHLFKVKMRSFYDQNVIKMHDMTHI